MSTTELSLLLGKTITGIIHHAQGQVGPLDWRGEQNEAIDFITADGSRYRMQHYQDCCEDVGVEEIIGDLGDLVNDGPVLLAEETSSNESGEWGDSTTWTFYKLRTLNGDVTIRWCGTSNGYYSEDVAFFEVKAA